MTDGKGRRGGAAASRIDILDRGEAQSNGGLRRGLTNRHIQLIAIGGAIGTGLFLGSGKAIRAAGPSILFVYAIIGFMLFFVMRAMGELLLHKLEYRSFQDFAADILGPWAGFMVGWTYWFTWVVIGMADVIAITGYWEHWVGSDRRWLSMLLAVVVMIVLLFMNLATVKLFGEIEFWFAIIKLVAIAALVITGIVMVVVGFEYGSTQASFTHLWDHGGLFPNGLTGFMEGFQLAVFAFVGIELVGTTAAETENPRVTLPRAINAIPVRVLLFYVLALAVIMSVTPWDQVSPEASPFVGLFKLVGLMAAASIMNAVMLSSAASSCNSGVYSTSRMLFGLAHRRMAPGIFRKLTRGGVPWAGLIVTVAIICCAHLLTLSGGVMRAFILVTTVSSVLFLFVWTIIIACYIIYRRRNPEAHRSSDFRMPGAAFMPWVVLAFFGFVIVALTTETNTRNALLATPLWFIVLGLAWARVRRRVRASTDGAPEPSGGDRSLAAKAEPDGSGAAARENQSEGAAARRFEKAEGE